MEHLAPLHSRLSSIIVTTPQAVALADAMKCLSFTRNVNLPVLGLIENMSGYVCPCCGEISNVFSTGGGEAMAARENLRLLGTLPVDTELVTLLDNEETLVTADGQTSTPNGVPTSLEPGQFPLLERYKRTPSFALFQVMVENVFLALPSTS